MLGKLEGLPHISSHVASQIFGFGHCCARLTPVFLFDLMEHRLALNSHVAEGDLEFLISLPLPHKCWGVKGSLPIIPRLFGAGV